MNIALVAPRYAPDFEGGTEIVVRAQARALAGRGHRVRVVAGTDRTIEAGASERGLARSTGSRSLHLARRDTEHYFLKTVRPRLLALVPAEVGDADVVHVHHWNTLSEGLVAQLSGSRPVGLTLHDYFATCPRTFRMPTVEGVSCPPRGDFAPCRTCLVPEITLPVDAFAARHARFQAELDAAAFVVFPSHSHRQGIGALLDLPETRTHLVPHGLPRPLGACFRAALRRSSLAGIGPARAALRTPLGGEGNGSIWCAPWRRCRAGTSSCF